MFYLEKKNWFGSKHAIVSEQFPFVTEISQTAASSFLKQKIILAVLLLVWLSFNCSIQRHFDGPYSSSNVQHISEENLKELNLK